MSELKPCPFHKSGCEMSVHTPIDLEGSGYQVVADCGVAGPWSLVREEAIEAWNHRTPDKDALKAAWDGALRYADCCEYVEDGRFEEWYRETYKGEKENEK
jgi:hypothetical protein